MYAINIRSWQSTPVSPQVQLKRKKGINSTDYYFNVDGVIEAEVPVEHFQEPLVNRGTWSIHTASPLEFASKVEIGAHKR